MAQEIVTWCDVHMEKDERVPGSTVTIAIDNKKARALDLCEQCHKELLGSLLEVLEGARIAANANPPVGHDDEGSQPRRSQPQRDMSCPICAEEGQQYHVTKRSTMRDHMRHNHDVVLADFESRLGETLDGLPLPYKCDFPGCGLRFSHPQGMGAHRRYTHGMKGSGKSTVAAQRKRERDAQEALAGT
jgi:hypothetical protein